MTSSAVADGSTGSHTDSAVRATVAVCLVVALLLMPALVAARDSVDDLIEEFNSAPRVARADHPLLPLNHVRLGTQNGSYFVSRRLAALGRAGRSFSVRDVSRKHNRCELKLESRDGQKKTRVSMMVVAEAAEGSSTIASLLPLVLADFFDFREAVHSHRFVACKDGLRRLHLATCNHVPLTSEVERFSSRADAEGAGYLPCGICFSVDTSAPIRAFAMTRAIAARDAHVYELVHPAVPDSILQQEVQQLGDSLVAALPFEPKGFEYRFRIVQSQFPTAESFATGFVYVSDKLLHSLDRRSELAFALAHEIAHVEMHLPEPDPPSVAESYLAYAAERRRHESEADLVAQTCLWAMGVGAANVRGVGNILRKMEYFAQEEAVDPKYEKYRFHPTVADRCARIERPAYFFPNAEGCAVGSEGDVILLGKLIAASVDSAEATILVVVEATPALARPLKLNRVEVLLAPGSWASFRGEASEIDAEGRSLLRLSQRSSGFQHSAARLAELRGGQIRFGAGSTEVDGRMLPECPE